jgi:hypothetical protein
MVSVAYTESNDWRWLSDVRFDTPSRVAPEQSSAPLNSHCKNVTTAQGLILYMGVLDVYALGHKNKLI